MRLRIWWLPGVPGEPFYVSVETVEEGHALLNRLVDYTRYLEGRELMSEYTADVGGLQAMDDDGDWLDAEFVLDDSAAWDYEPLVVAHGG